MINGEIEKLWENRGLVDIDTWEAKEQSFVGLGHNRVLGYHGKESAAIFFELVSFSSKDFDFGKDLNFG